MNKYYNVNKNKKKKRKFLTKKKLNNLTSVKKTFLF